MTDCSPWRGGDLHRPSTKKSEYPKISEFVDWACRADDQDLMCAMVDAEWHALAQQKNRDRLLKVIKGDQLIKVYQTLLTWPSGKNEDPWAIGENTLYELLRLKKYKFINWWFEQAQNKEEHRNLLVFNVSQAMVLQPEIMGLDGYLNEEGAQWDRLLAAIKDAVLKNWPRFKLQNAKAFKGHFYNVRSEYAEKLWIIPHQADWERRELEKAMKVRGAKTVSTEVQTNATNRLRL